MSVEIRCFAMSVFYTLSVIRRRDSRLNLDFDQPLRLFATQPFEEKKRRDKHNRHQQPQPDVSAFRLVLHFSS